MLVQVSVEAAKCGIGVSLEFTRGLPANCSIIRDAAIRGGFRHAFVDV